MKFELPERILSEIEECYNRKQTDLRVMIGFKQDLQLINQSPLTTSPTEEISSKLKKAELDTSKEISNPHSRGIFSSFLNKVSELSGSFKARLTNTSQDVSEDQKERSMSWESSDFRYPARSQERMLKIDNIIKANFEEGPKSNQSSAARVNKELRNLELQGPAGFSVLSGLNQTPSLETGWKYNDMMGGKTPVIHDDSPIKKPQSRDRLGSGDKFAE